MTDEREGLAVNRRRRRQRRNHHHEALLADPAVQAGVAAVRAALEPAGPLVPQAFATVDPEELSVVFRRMGPGERSRFLSYYRLPSARAPSAALCRQLLAKLARR